MQLVAFTVLLPDGVFSKINFNSKIFLSFLAWQVIMTPSQLLMSKRLVRTQMEAEGCSCTHLESFYNLSLVPS